MLKVWEVACDNNEKYLVIGEKRDIIEHVLSDEYEDDFRNPLITDIRYVKTIWDRVWGSE